MSAVQQMILAGGGADLSLTCDAADFDGTDYLQKSTTGPSDSRKFVFVCWLCADDDTGTIMQFTNGAGGHFTVSIDENRAFRVDCWSATSVNILDMRATTELPLGVWTCVLASVDIAQGSSAIHMYYGDTSVKNVLAFDNNGENIRFTPSVTPTFGSGQSGNLKMNTGIAEVWFSSDVYIDFSIEGNRRKFLLSTGKPANVGSDGSWITGTAPYLYLHLDDGEAAENFAVNTGTGGDYSVNGTLTTRASSPSD